MTDIIGCAKKKHKIVKIVKKVKLTVIKVLNNFSATSGGFSLNPGTNFVNTATVAL